MTKKIALTLIGFNILFIFFTTPKQVFAAVSSCTASVSPSSVHTSTSTSFDFTLNNTSSSTIVWIKITRPSSDFTITDQGVGGWSGGHSSSDVTFGGGSLAASDSLSFNVNATSGSSEGSSEDWTVQVSDDAGGTSPTTCTGSLGTTISGAPADTTPPSISDLVVSDVTDSSVKVMWTTDESSSSVVEYGTDDQYGTSASGDGSITSHSVSISGLSANTTYHYNAKSTDSNNNVAESGDNTFVTAKTGTTGTTVTGTVTTTTTIVKATPTPAPDTVGPYVVIATKVEKPFTEAPVIKGTATDKSFVATLEYSVDDGKNWLPVDFIDKPNTVRTDFSFTPQLLDGNYKVKIRAKDSKGNASTTDVGTLVIDRLPPRIGGVIFSLGPQELLPTQHGSYTMLSGLDYKITLSAVGGPLSIDIHYIDYDGTYQKINLKKSSDNALWSGYLHFASPGEYVLQLSSIDGADNAINIPLSKIVVLQPGKVASGSTAVSRGSVSVYYLSDTDKRFVLWDGSAYGQSNPQPLTREGEYRLYLPSGTYYLRIAAGGYKTIVSSIFTLQDPSPIVTSFDLIRARAIKIGPWLIPLPDFTQVTAAVSLPTARDTAGSFAQSAVSSEFPYFKLGESSDALVSTSLRGKPTLIVFLNTWLPQAAAQLSVLSDLSIKKEMNIVAIIPQETASSVAMYKKRAGLSVTVLADPDGGLIDSLGLHALPSHVFVDRKGIIKYIQTGLYDKEQLLDMLIK